VSFPRYPKYKDSGVGWLGQVPEHWQVRPLKTLCEMITDGAHVSPETEGGVFPFVSTKDIHGEVIDFENCLRTSEPTFAAMVKTGCRPCLGDVLYSKDGTIGRTAVVTDARDFAVASSLIIIRPRKGSLESRFVNRLCQSSAFTSQIESAVRGAGLPRISIQNLLKVVGPFPEVSEQRLIAEFLDRETAKIDLLLGEQQRLIELLKEKRQAVISQAVTKGLNPHAPMKPSGITWLGDVPAHWEGVRLRTLFRAEKRQNQSGLQVLSVYREFGVIPKNSRDDNMNKTPDDLTLYQLVNQGDLVVNKMKAWQGSLGISDLEGVTSPDYITFTPRLKPSPALRGFLHQLLRSQSMVSVYRSISNGIRPAQWRLEPGHFLGLPIFVPPAREQQDLVAFASAHIERSNALSAAAERAMALLQERRAALISAAITGQIDVRSFAGKRAA